MGITPRLPGQKKKLPSYAERTLNPLRLPYNFGKPAKIEVGKAKPAPLSQPEQMRRTLEAVRKNNYKGGNFVK